ncbi:MAG: hypothetical protein OXE82_11170 [Rhodobacter sp.]|nr:hypothetical protein [Rhodobacter sp.]
MKAITGAGAALADGRPAHGSASRIHAPSVVTDHCRYDRRSAEGQGV